MAFRIELESDAEKALEKISRPDTLRILKKLQYFSETPNPIIFAKSLTNFSLGDYRFRIGDYRVIVRIKNNTIYVVNIGHRREIYR